jgi:tetratricopeptide (TPR) repeat protein
VPTQDAYHLYLKGRYFLNRRGPVDIQRAIAHFEEAIAADSAYAAPHAGIAETFGVLGIWGFLPPAQAYGRMKAAAKRAIELDDSLAEAHFTLAQALLLNDWDFAGARALFDRGANLPASDGLGRYALAMFYLSDGRVREAVGVARRMVADDPLSSIAHTQSGAVYAAISQFDDASPLLEKALELIPGMPMALFWLGFCRGVQGRLDESIALLKEASSKGMSSALMYLPAVLAKANKMEEARAVTAQLEHAAAQGYIPPLARVMALAAIGDEERARALLAEAEAERTPILTLGLIGPGFWALMPEWLTQWFAIRRRALMPGAWQPDAAPVPREDGQRR